MAIEFVSKLMEFIPTRTNDAQVVKNFVKANIFYKFGVLRVLINDVRSYFYNKLLKSLLSKYGVAHMVSTPYHPQTNGQVKLNNIEIKRIL